MAGERTLLFRGDRVNLTESQRVLLNLRFEYYQAVDRWGWWGPNNQQRTDASETFHKGLIDGLTSGVIKPEDLATVFADTIRSEAMYKNFSDSGRDDDY